MPWKEDTRYFFDTRYFADFYNDFAIFEHASCSHAPGSCFHLQSHQCLYVFIPEAIN